MQETQHDNELADLTDALLAGRPVTSGAEPELAAIARQLAQIITAEPSPTFRARLAERLNREWAQRKRSGGLTRRALIRLTALAAALILVLGAVLLAAQPNQPGALEGSVSGALPPQFILFFGAFVAAALVYFAMRRRR